MSDPDFKMLFELYYPVIAEARKVRERYTPLIEEDGKRKRKSVVVCPDETAAMIDALNLAESKVCVVQNVESTSDAP